MGGGGIGQPLQKQIGQTGIPVYNVANACATGATAMRVAIMAVKAGEVDMGLAVGVEKLAGAGLLAGGTRAEDSSTWTPQGRQGAVAPLDGRIGTQTMPGVFAQIGMEYGHKYGGTSFELFAKISEKNHAHSTLNPLASYQKRMSVEEIMNDVMIAYPNTRPMCSANCDGAAAAVIVSDSKLKTLSAEQRRRAVKISASVLTTDPWEEACQVLPDVNTLTRNAARQAYEQAGIGPEDLNLVELHDCFATAELVHYDNLMLCEEGGAVDFFNSGATWRDGKTPVNVSGGLESKGHPDLGHRHRQRVGGVHAPAGGGGSPSDRGRQGRTDPRHRPREHLRSPHPREGRRVTTTEAKYISYETLADGKIARIMLNRPDARNAQNRGLLVELDEAFLRGRGGRPGPGGDPRRRRSACSRRATTWARRRRWPSGATGRTATRPRSSTVATRKGAEPLMLQEWHYFFENTRRWRNLRKITIAQVHGPVYAAGLMLMWACDLIVAAENTTFADVVGTRLGMCGVEYFAHPWEFGPRKTKELMLTGDSLDVEEAHRLGMVSKIFPADELADRTLEFARADRASCRR